VLRTANEKALETVKMIEQIVDTFGWKLSYTELQLPKAQAKIISNE